MGREMGGTSLGGGVITEGHDETWDVSGLPATVNMWHHVVLVYDSDSVIFYVRPMLCNSVCLDCS